MWFCLQNFHLTQTHLHPCAPGCSFHAGYHNGPTIPDPNQGVAFPMVNHHRTVFMAEELGHGVCYPQFKDLEVVMLSVVQKVQAESIVGVKLE